MSPRFSLAPDDDGIVWVQLQADSLGSRRCLREIIETETATETATAFVSDVSARLKMYLDT